MEHLTIAQLTTVAGVASATTLLNFVLWRTTGASDAVKSRFGPIAALVTGLIVSVVAGLFLAQGGADLAQTGLNGVIGGLTAIGIYDLVASKAGATA